MVYQQSECGRHHGSFISASYRAPRRPPKERLLCDVRWGGLTLWVNRSQPVNAYNMKTPRDKDGIALVEKILPNVNAHGQTRGLAGPALRANQPLRVPSSPFIPNKVAERFEDKVRSPGIWESARAHQEWSHSEPNNPVQRYTSLPPAFSLPSIEHEFLPLSVGDNRSRRLRRL